MSKRIDLLFLFLCAVCLLGCESASSNTISPVSAPLSTLTPDISPVAPTSPPTRSLSAVRPGVYLADDLGELPLPTSGYELYVVGEPHGQKEVRDLAFEYLVKLYETAGTRSLVLEQIPPVYESEVNGYVLGTRDNLSLRWAFAADMLINVRKFNDNRPPGDKIRVYLSDLDYEFSSILAHIRALYAEIADGSEGMEMPMLSEFKTWEEIDMLALVDAIKVRAGNRKDAVAALETAGDSIRWQFIRARMLAGEMTSSEFIQYEYIREERIAANVQRILAEQEGNPVLVLYGGYHTQKFPALVVAPYGEPFFLDSASWVQRAAEAGTKVYSVFCMGVSGRQGLLPHEESVEKNVQEIRFADGMTAGDLYAANPEANVLYIDLRIEENHTMRFGNDFVDVDAGRIYDGAIFFREVHPQDWEQYP